QCDHQHRAADCGRNRSIDLTPYRRTSAKAACSFARPFSPAAPSTTTFTRTSLVLIISTLTPASERALNMRIATPTCVRRPTPLTDSLLMTGLDVTCLQPSDWAMRLAASTLLLS